MFKFDLEVMNSDGKFIYYLTENEHPLRAFLKAYGGKPQYGQLMKILISDEIQEGIRDQLHLKGYPTRSCCWLLRKTKERF
jgi:hypothetical protein